MTTTPKDHEARLADAAADYRDAAAELDTARLKLAQRINAAAEDGVRQVDILRAIDHVWSREYLRKLYRGEAGYVPAGDVPWQRKQVVTDLSTGETRIMPKEQS